MFDPLKKFGKYDQIKITNFEVEIKFNLDKFEIEEKKIQHSIEPEFHNIYYLNNRKVREEKKVHHSDFINITNFLYDFKHNLIEINQPCIDINEELYIRYSFIYSEKDLLIKKIKFEFENEKWINYYEYDNLNKLRTEKWRSMWYPLIDHNYFYDKKGNMINKVSNYLQGPVDVFLDDHFLYDDKNRLVKKYSESISEILKYNDSGLLSESIIYTDSENYTNKNYYYDEFGNLIKIIEKSYYLYSGQIKTADEFVCEWVYESFQNSDWTKVIHYKDGKPILITKRELISK